MAWAKGSALRGEVLGSGILGIESGEGSLGAGVNLQGQAPIGCNAYNEFLDFRKRGFPRNRLQQVETWDV